MRRGLMLLAITISVTSSVFAQSDASVSSEPWVWLVLLFLFTVLLGVVAVIGGVGGGVLFVPIVAAVFPFHFDFVRGTGLFVGLCGAISAGPRLLRGGLASMRLGLPLAMAASVGSVGGAYLGLVLPTTALQAALGILIIGTVVMMLSTSGSQATTLRPDPVAAALGLAGIYEEAGSPREWRVHRFPLGLVVFGAIGVFAGMLGIGGGWAYVPALTMLLGAPLRVSVATSGFIITLNSTAASWVYLNSGAVLPLIAAPSIAGMMIGTRIGARLLPRMRTGAIRLVVIGVLLVSGVRSLVAGFLGV